MTTSATDRITQQLSTGTGDFRPPTWLDHPEPRSFTPKQKYRTIWISDIHLGTSGCNATLLLDFLASVECERCCQSNANLSPTRGVVAR